MKEVVFPVFVSTYQLNFLHLK